MKTIKLMALLGISGLVLSACSDDDSTPEEVNEEEVITTMTITLTPEGGGDAVTFQTRDIDGDDGPEDPVVTAGNLLGNTTYNATIELSNETEEPAEDITAEIREEDDEHQFFFQYTGAVDSAAATDTDGDGNPVGLSFDLTTITAGPASLTVTLRHEPNKPNDGTLEDAGGSTDITATFDFNVVDEL